MWKVGCIWAINLSGLNKIKRGNAGIHYRRFKNRRITDNQ
jgi:hypothetical protein